METAVRILLELEDPLEPTDLLDVSCSEAVGSSASITRERYSITMIIGDLGIRFRATGETSP